MKTQLKTYGPALLLAIVVTAIPLMRPAQAEPPTIHDPDNWITSIQYSSKLQNPQPLSHEVVILHFYESSFSAKIDTNGGTVYGYTGFKLQSAESSAGAPQYQGAIVENYYDRATTNWVSIITNKVQSGAQIVADLMNSGYRIVSSDLGEFGPKILLVR